MPTTVAWPPRRVDDHAARIVSARPTHSKAWSAPRPPVSSRTCLATSDEASRKSVAPNRWAISAFSATGSTAMICSAPAIRAACTALRPMPPSPNTTTLSPERTRAALKTAPAPVSTAQPSSATFSSGTSSATRTQEFAPTTVSVANAAVPSPGCTGVPSPSLA